MQIIQMFIAFLAITLISQDVHKATEIHVEELVRIAGPSVASVKSYGRDGKMLSEGTAFVATPFTDDPKRRFIVTNRHVVRGATKVEIVFPTHNPLIVSGVVAEDILHDLVVLLVDDLPSGIAALELAPSLPNVGQRIVVIGNAAGLSNTASDGIVSSAREFQEIGCMIQMTAPISAGSSGSPVITSNGRVVGVATSQLATGQNINFAVPAARLTALRHGASVPVGTWSGSRAKSDYMLDKRATPNSVPEGTGTPYYWFIGAISNGIIAQTENKRNGLQFDSGLLMLDIADAAWLAGDAKVAVSAIGLGLNCPKRVGSMEIASRAIDLYLRMGDFEAASMLITSNLSEGERGRVDNLKLYCDAVMTAASQQSSPDGTVKSVGKLVQNAKDELKRIPKPKYDPYLKRLGMGTIDRVMASSSFVKAMVAIGDDVAARDILAEMGGYLRVDSSHAWLLWEVEVDYHKANIERWLTLRNFVEAEKSWAQLNSVPARAGLPIEDNPYGGGPKSWLGSAEFYRTAIAHAALVCGETEIYRKYREWLDKQMEAGVTIGGTTAAVKLLLLEGDMEAAMRLAQRTKESLIYVVCRFAELGDLEKASRYLSFLPESDRMTACLTIAECAWEAGDAELFDQRMQEAERALKGVGRGSDGIYASSRAADRASGITRWGKLKARSSSLNDLWMYTQSDAYKRLSPGVQCLFSLGVARQLLLPPSK